MIDKVTGTSHSIASIELAKDMHRYCEAILKIRIPC